MVGDMPDFHQCLKKPSSVIYWKLYVYTSIKLTIQNQPMHFDENVFI